MPHRLNTYLASNQDLRQLARKAQQLKALQRCYESIAPPSLQGGSRVLQLHQQTVVIVADNGAVAAKLRQMTTEMISLFQARGCEITGIQIRVQVSSLRPAARTVPRKLGPRARAALEKLGHELDESPLSAALRRLARRH